MRNAVVDTVSAGTFYFIITELRSLRWPLFFNIRVLFRSPSSIGNTSHDRGVRGEPLYIQSLLSNEWLEARKKLYIP